MNVHLISDFNIETLGNYLENDSTEPRISVSRAAFGQVVPALLEQADRRSSVAVVWTSLAAVSPSFHRAVDGHAVSQEQLRSEVEEFANCIKQARSKFKAVFVVTWTLPAYQRGLGMLDLRSRSGLRRCLLQMNLELISFLEDAESVYLLDAQRWMESIGKGAYSPKLWFLSKSPFLGDVFREAAKDIKAAVRGVLGMARKLLIVDLDNTLWGGIVGDVGWENLVLGGHDHAGEALVAFQRALQALTTRGILLGVVSRNEEAVALEAMSKHAEMVLRPENFVGWRINWNDKAANIVSLAAELRLGLESVVFIDDSPVERARVRESLPGVLVPEWPADKTLYPSALLQLDCFDTPQLTVEDARRSEMYTAERQREESKKSIPSFDDWLLSLNTNLTIEPLSEASLGRVTQLFNKTNQMNLTTRRLSQSELFAWAQSDQRRFWAFRVSDRFGDSGLTGILSLEFTGPTAEIIDFILSCRVMGRKVEEAMLSVAVQHCQRLGVEQLTAVYLPTSRNKPCLDFWMRSGFDRDEEGNRFSWSLERSYPVPRGVEIATANDLLMKEAVV